MFDCEYWRRTSNPSPTTATIQPSTFRWIVPTRATILLNLTIVTLPSISSIERPSMLAKRGPVITVLSAGTSIGFEIF